MSKKKQRIKEQEYNNKSFKEKLKDSFKEPIDKANLKKVLIIGIIGAILSGLVGGLFDFVLFRANALFFIGVFVSGFTTAGLVAVFKEGRHIIYPLITLGLVLLSMFFVQLMQYIMIYIVSGVWNVGYLFIYTFFFPWISLFRSFQVVGQSEFTSYFWTGMLNLAIYLAVFIISFIGVYRSGRNDDKNK